MEFVEVFTCDAFIPVYVNSALCWEVRELITNWQI